MANPQHAEIVKQGAEVNRVMFQHCRVFLLVVLAVGSAFGRASRGDETRSPWPSADAVAREQARLGRVYNDEMSRATTAEQKTAIAEKLLNAGDFFHLSDAGRVVLLSWARDRAVDAGNAGVAMAVVRVIVRRFEPDGPTDPKEQIQRANALWKEAEAAAAGKRLDLQIQAAEWYLRAQPAAAGTDAKLVAERLGMLAKLEGKPSPRPAKDALAKAEAKVRQTFKDDLASAAKPKAKAALAEKLLKAAERADNDDAARLALLTVARDLAIQAGDAHAAMKAVRAIVRHFEPDGLTDAKAQFERANALWKEAEAARAGKRLPLQLEAQELYLRAWPEAIEADELLLIGERLALLEKLAGGMPSGWVKLINQTAGFEFPNAYLDSHLSGSLFHFEPAGEYYTIREKQSGRYLVVRETRGGIRPVWAPPNNNVVNYSWDWCDAKDAGKAATRWQVRRSTDGFWTIADPKSGHCLRLASGQRFAQLAAPEEDAPEQQWRLEPASE